MASNISLGNARYIAAQRPLTAVAVVSRIREKRELITTQPGIGQRRPETTIKPVPATAN